MQIDYEKYARIFKVMSDPKRLKIIDMLSEGELCACKILEEFHITQPTLSHDMKLMCDLGIVMSGRLENDSFKLLDTVVRMNGFHAFPDKQKAFHEIWRVLKPGGNFMKCFYIRGKSQRTDWLV